ncbi:MAG: Ig-like domain-containing protein [Treponema sp.]
MKAFRSFSLVLAVVCTSVFALTTCKDVVGLGEAVDINPPIIRSDSIYPPMNAVVRGSFCVSVTVEDDRKVETVSAMLTCLDGGAAYSESFYLENHNNQWQVFIDRSKNQHKYRPVDGKYKLKILAKDASGKEVESESRLVIDNTPPLLVLSRPSTAVASGSTAGDADIFGDSFFLAGQVYDSCAVKSLEIIAQSADGQNYTETLTNIPQTIRMTVDSFSAANPGFYKKLYGDNPAAGNKTISYSIKVTDSARSYTDPQKIKGEGEGNSTETYYLNGDLYSDVLKKYEIDTVYNMTRRTYHPDGLSVGVDKSISDAAVTQVLTTLNEKAITKAGERKGVFALNPSINPKYGIEGHSPKTIPASGSLTGLFEDIYEDAAINVKLSPNFDDDPLNAADSYRFYLISLEDYYAAHTTYTVDVNDNTQLYVNGTDGALQTGIIEIGSTLITKKSISGSSHIITLKLPPLAYTKHYMLQVRGNDQKHENHTMIADPKESGGSVYGFKVKKNGAAPVVTVGQINGKAADNGRFYIKKGDTAVFSVTVQGSSGGQVFYSLKAGTAEKAREEITYPLSGGGNIEFTIGTDAFNQAKSAAYTLTVQAADNAGRGSSQPALCQIYYDVEGPVITANAPSLVTAMPEITGDIYDAGCGVDFTSIRADYKYNSGTEQSLPFAEAASADNQNWKLSAIPTPKEGKYEIVLTAKDRLGQAGKPTNLTFMYDTEKPRLQTVQGIAIDLLRKGTKLESSTNTLSLTGTILEKNTIKTLKIGKKGGTQDTVSAVRVTGSDDTYNFTHSFSSLEDGDHTFVIMVEDAAGKTDSAEVTAVVDTKPPLFKTMKIGAAEFKVETSSNPFNSKKEITSRTATVPVSGEFEDKGQGVKELIAEWVEDSEQRKEVFTAVPVAGKANTYKAAGAITLVHTHSDVRFTIKDGSGRTAPWETTIIRSTETLSADIHMIAPKPAPYTNEDTPYVKDPFTLQLSGTYNGDKPQNLELHINKDGAKLSDDDLIKLGVNIKRNGVLFSGVLLHDNVISGFKSGIKGNETEKYTVTFNPAANHSTDGRYVFSFRSPTGDVQKQLVVWVDTKAPELTPRVPVDGQSLKDQPNLFAVIADTPGAGIKTVTAKLNGSADIPLKAIKGNSVESKTTLSLAEGENTIAFNYSDHLGNAGSKTITFQYDKTPPELLNIKIDGKDSDTVLIGTETDGKMKPFTVAGTVKDSIKVKAAYLTITNKQTRQGTSLLRKMINSQEGDITWTVDNETLKSISPGSQVKGLYTLSISAEDTAGLITTVVKNFEVDSDKPEITVKTPKSTETVNGTILVSGTASDKQQLKSLKVIKKGSPNTPLTGVTDSTGDTLTQSVFNFEGEKAGSWSFKLDTVQHIGRNSGTGSGSIVLTVIAEDMVGNQTEQDCTIVVDQDKDRPLITITSFDKIAQAQLNNSKTLTGTISDDDGLVPSLKIKIGSSSYQPVTFGLGGSFWTYDLGSLADADYTINFQVTDAAGTVFDTEAAGKLIHPNIIGKNDALTAGKDTAVSFKLDNTPPQIEAGDVRFVLGTSLAGLNETSEDSKIIANKKIGNANNKKASFRVFAKDSSGIDEVELFLGNGAGKKFVRNTAKDKKNGTKIEWEAWEVLDVDLTEGTHVLKIKVTDKSGFPNYWQETVVCDFTAPTIIMQNPLQESGSWAKELLVGKTVVSGLFSDGASGMMAMTAGSTAYTCKIGKNKSPLLSRDKFEVSASGLTWTLELTDASEYGTTVYSDERFKPDFTSNASGKIYKVPLSITAQDNAGNKAENTFYLTIDSDGKTPKVSIFGPDQASTTEANGTEAHNGLKKVTLGGTVRFYGDAAVNKPSSGAKVTVIEARFSKRPDFTEAFTKEVSAGLPNAGTMKDWAAGVPVVEDTTAGISSWNFSIESAKFLNGAAGGNIDLYYSIRAKNDEGTYCDWTPARIIKLDQNAPIFDSPKIQKSGVESDYVSGKFVTEGNYLLVDLISTTGISSISVEVANAGSEYNGLKNLTGSTAEEAKTAILAAKVGTEKVFTEYTSSGKSGYKMKLPLNTKTMTDPDQNCKITINLRGGQSNGAIPNFNQFNLKYDNTKPSVVFGVPEGEGGLAQFTTSGASGVEAASSSMNTDNLYVFVATKDGTAKELKVTAVGNKTLSYDLQSAGTFADKSEYILFRKDPIVFDHAGKYQLEGIIYDTGSGVESVKPSITTALSGITKFTSLQGQFSSFKEGIVTNTLADGKQELKLLATDKAGNAGTEYKTDIFLRNKPLKIEEVTFKTDLNGNNSYSDDVTKGLVELVTEKGHDNYVNEKKNYNQTLNIKNRFTFKNKDYSQISFKLAGGQGSNRNFELYKADSSGNPSGTVLKSAPLAANAGNYNIDLTSADFANNKIPQGENQTFVIVLKDDASTGDTARKLMLTVTLNVKTEDKSKPQVVIMPFYWNGEDNNSLADNNRENGHIEITKVSSGSGESDVSGKVVLRGIAYHPTKLTKLELTGAGATVTASYTGGTWSNPAGFTVTDTAFDVNGHWVRWEYIWETGAPELSKAITMKAYHNTVESIDAAGSAAERTAAARPTIQSLTLASGDTAVAGQFLRLYEGEQSYLVTISKITGQEVEWKLTNVPKTITKYQLYSIAYSGSDASGKAPVYSKPSLTVNIVPYISKIETFVSESAGVDFARSALGDYPVRAQEEIKLYGFNITEKPVVKMHSKTLKIGEKKTDEYTKEYYPVTVEYHPAGTPVETVKSGKLEVTVKNIPAINNSNAEPTFDNKGNPITAVYNVQTTAANKRLTDNLSLSVWKIDGMGISKDITSPMLKVDSKSNWYMSYGEGVPKMVVNKNGTETCIDYSYNKFHNTAVAFDASGNIYALATNTDRVDNYSAKFSFYSRAVEKASGNSSYQHMWLGKSWLEKVFNQNIYNINRVKRPKITAKGDTANAEMYIAYFDSNHPDNPVKFRYGKVDSTNSFTNGFVGNHQLDANIMNEGLYNVNAHTIANKTTKYKGGEYAAVGVTSTGVAVVAWYDASAKQLLYSWNDNPATVENASDTSKWQKNVVVIDKGYAGWYVDLTVDEKDGIHIAYYNSAKGDLKYSYIPKYNEEYTGNKHPEVVTVDSYLSVGTQIMITTRKENDKIIPYISYYHASFTQTPSSVRVAWCKDVDNLADGAKEDYFTGKWEAMTIPVTDVPKDETICNGVPTTGIWANTMIVGFMTDDGYKKAVLQK